MPSLPAAVLRALGQQSTCPNHSARLQRARVLFFQLVQTLEQQRTRPNGSREAAAHEGCGSRRNSHFYFHFHFLFRLFYLSVFLFFCFPPRTTVACACASAGSPPHPASPVGSEACLPRRTDGRKYLRARRSWKYGRGGGGCRTRHVHTHIYIKKIYIYIFI